MIGIWRKHRTTSVAGILACLTMVFACASSGPILSAMAAIGALFLWRYHNQPMQLRFIRWFAVLVYITLDLFMREPAYYLIAEVDLVGGSTGWHRARLIQMAIKHLPEWWLSGTDYTRHWMPSGVSWSEMHADITNHYLGQGVLGGFPLMLLFIAILFKGFSIVGQTLKQGKGLTRDSRLIIWVVGSSLFAHAVTFLGISSYDQSSLFLYLTLAAIGAIKSMSISAQFKENSAK
jgi:hypothetical protein